MGNVPEKTAEGSNVVLRAVSAVVRLWWNAAERLQAVFAENTASRPTQDVFTPDQPLCERCKRQGVHSCSCDRGDPMWNQVKI